MYIIYPIFHYKALRGLVLVKRLLVRFQQSEENELLRAWVMKSSREWMCRSASVGIRRPRPLRRTFGPASKWQGCPDSGSELLFFGDGFICWVYAVGIGLGRALRLVIPSSGHPIIPIPLRHSAASFASVPSLRSEATTEKEGMKTEENNSW